MNILLKKFKKNRRAEIDELRLQERIRLWYERYYINYGLMLPTDIIHLSKHNAEQVMDRLREYEITHRYRCRLPYSEMVRVL